MTSTAVAAPAADSRRRFGLARSLASLGAAASIGSALLTIALGLGSLEVIVVGIFAAMALLGGLIATRRPENRIGWLMVGSGLLAGLMLLPTDYGYVATVLQPGWPLGTAALWLGTWSWTPLLGVVLPAIAVRFPDGRVLPGGRLVDRLILLGTAGFAVGIAFAPSAVLVDYLPISHSDRVAPFVSDPFGLSLTAGALDVLRVISVVVIVVGYGLAIASLVGRFRAADGDERLQILWFGYAVGLTGAAAGYGLVSWGFLQAEIGNALLPLDFVAYAVPVAIAIGILRYQLLDIELVINRTLVYGLLTAMLAAGYAATITLLQRLLVAISGSTADVVYVLAAFFVVAAFSPLRDWLQRAVDRRLGGRNPVAVLAALSASIGTVLDTIEPERAVGRLLDQAIAAFDARGGAVYLGNGERRLVRGRPPSDGVALQLPIEHDGRVFGMIELGPRRGGGAYSTRDRTAMQDAADSVGAALDLAYHLRR